MARLASKGENAYSVDLLIAYVNIYKPAQHTIEMSDLAVYIEQPCWLAKNTGEIISPAQVLADPERYPFHAESINNADTRYPIIICDEYGMMDGKHRLAKAYRNGNTYINAYILDKTIVDKCYAGPAADWQRIQQQTKPHELIELFHERFSIS
jgi:hypothetical protein